MTWHSSTAATRRASPSHKEWIPSAGQAGAVEHLISNGAAAVWADPGGGKTSITLSAFAALKEAGVARKMLVLAPLRVCQLVWRQETAKWSHTKHLKVALLHGPKKDERLREEADIYLLNYEGIPWLTKKFHGRPLPFDTIVADELTKLKNHTSKRHKALQKHIQRTPRKWGLTGTPAPNGYLDLFGQFLFLDGGATLGKFFSHYRDNYFKPDYDGFNWVLQRGAEDRIKNAIEPMVYRLEYDDLPQIGAHVIEIELDPAARSAYDTFKRDELMNVDGGMVTAGNAAAMYAKLRQMANGAVYLSDEVSKAKGAWAHIHDAKLDALCDLFESLNGKPLMVAYHFHHDLERIQKRFKELYKLDVPYLGSGVSEKKAEQLQDAWNRNEIPILLCHPASVGHGLNLQEGGAQHLCWFSLDFDLELYDQFRRRIWRKGNTAESITEHILIVLDSMDEVVREALQDKDTTQARLLQGLRRVLHNEGTPAAGSRRADTETDTMAINRMPRQGGGSAPAPQQEKQERVMPKGWGKQAAARDDEGEDDVQEEQTSNIRSKLSGGKGRDPEPEPEQDEGEEPVEAKASSMFKGALNKALGKTQEAEQEADEGQAEAPPETAKPRATRSRKAAEPAEKAAPEAVQNASNVGSAPGAFIEIRVTGNDPAAIRAALRAFLG